MQLIVKKIPVKYIRVDGVDLKARELEEVLEQLIDSETILLYDTPIKKWLLSKGWIEKYMRHHSIPPSKRKEVELFNTKLIDLIYAD